MAIRDGNSTPAQDGPGFRRARVQCLLERYPAEGTVLHPVSSRVNAVRNDDESCIAPVE